VSFATITLCVASQQVFIIIVVYFVINSVKKLLSMPSYAGVYIFEILLLFIELVWPSSMQLACI
jgi:hypothetical protein